jgi:hypothetical protein
MTGSAYKNLRMFGNICGDDAAARVVLVSTMWDRLTELELPDAVGREDQLKQEFWNTLIDKGSGHDRLKPNTPDEAWRIVTKLIDTVEEREVLLLQEEVVNMGRELNETEAGKALYTELQKLLAIRKRNLELYRTQAKKSGDSTWKEELDREYNKTQKEFDKTFAEARSMKVSILRQIRLLVFGKKAHAVS